MTPTAITLADKFAQFHDLWHPRIIGELKLPLNGLLKASTDAGPVTGIIARYSNNKPGARILQAPPRARSKQCRLTQPWAMFTSLSYQSITRL